jgi:trehalose/maltose transport system substrate-binding protein
MRQFLLASLIAAASSLGFASTGHAAAISIFCSALGQEMQLCQDGVNAWAAKTGNTVKVISTPNSATERLALYQQMLSAGSADVDVFQIDITWPGTLQTQLIDLSPYIPKEQIAQNLARAVAADTVGGKLVAMPWFSDAGLLYYRRDLLSAYGLPPPQTWQQLSDEAAEIQAKQRAAGNSRFWGYVFQAQAYEGLTCNALEWIDSFGGGTIVGPDGKITVDNPQSAQAIAWATATVGKIAPEGVLNYQEEEARGVFQSGNAAFMRNWPYAWALAESDGSPVRGKVAVSALPSGTPEGPRTGTLGGQNLAVSRFSKHPQEAASLVGFLTSVEQQKHRAIAGSFNPTIESLYHDPEVQKAVPFLEALYPAIRDAVPRPSAVTGARYNEVSAAIFQSVHQALAGSMTAQAAMHGLARQLERLSRGGRW